MGNTAAFHEKLPKGGRNVSAFKPAPLYNNKLSKILARDDVRLDMPQLYANFESVTRSALEQHIRDHAGHAFTRKQEELLVNRLRDAIPRNIITLDAA